MDAGTACSQAVLRVDDVANILDVTPNTIRNWVDAGWLEAEETDRTIRFTQDALMRAPVLRRGELLRRPELVKASFDEVDLARAKLDGAVRPTEGLDGRYALNDVEVLVRWKRGEWYPPAPTEPVDSARSAARWRASAMDPDAETGKDELEGLLDALDEADSSLRALYRRLAEDPDIATEHEPEARGAARKASRPRPASRPGNARSEESVRPRPGCALRAGTEWEFATVRPCE